MNDYFLITCEHGGNRVPARYREFFRGREELLRTHRAVDIGALRVARELADLLSAPMVVCTVSRLLIELNRSPRHPKLLSEAVRHAPQEIREELYRRYYQPYRDRVEALAEQAIAGGARVVHISSHSFTPELNGEVRNADVGLLYDPARSAEAQFCRRWRSALKLHAPALTTRMNYPYKGISDGFTVHLRRRFPGDSYLGIELEINQKHALQRGEHWRRVRNAVAEALHDAALSEHAAARDMQAGARRIHP